MVKKFSWPNFAGPRTGWRHVLPLTAILLLNIVVAFPLLLPGYTQNTLSIESSYMAVAKIISQAFPWPEWDLRWYGGYPFRLSYTPLLPYVIALLHLGSISLTTAYRIVTSTLFVLTPLALYWLAYGVTRRHLTAALSAVIFTVVSPASFMMAPVFEMCRAFSLVTWRMLVLAYWGEGPHTCGLVLTPLAVFVFLRFLREPTFRRLLLCSALISVVTLTNLTAAIGLGIILGGMWITELAFGYHWKKLASALLMAVTVMGLCAFWYNPDFVRLVFGIGRQSADRSLMQSWGAFWWLWLALAGILTVLLLLFRRRPETQPLLRFLVPSILLGILPFTHFVYQANLIPQSHRFLPELDMMVSVVCAILLTWVYDRLASQRTGRAALAATALLFLVVLAVWGPRILVRQHKPFYPLVEFQGFEKRAADWFTANVQRHERVFLTGNTVFWLNVFSDVAQTRGGLANNSHPYWATLDSFWTLSDDLDLIVLWSKAFNVRYALVNFPDSRDPWRSFQRQERFEGKLKEVHAFEGNRIFEIPMPSYDLVTIVDGAALAAIPPRIQDPGKGGGIEDYVRMVEGGRETRYWLGPRNTFHIEAEIGQNEVVLVKTTYDRGWKASCRGRQLPVQPDPAGFMLIQTGSPGRCEILLEHGRVWEEWFGYGLTMLTLAGLGGYGYRRRKESVTSGKI